MKYCLLLLISMTACSSDNIVIPKPPTYLRIDLPDHAYSTYKGSCGYSFKINKIYAVKEVKSAAGKSTCHKDIDLGPLNGIMHFSYIQMSEPLARYINYANDKVDEHKLKATAIEDFQIISRAKRVYGTFFELQGNVASPFQFYLTDSSRIFVSGVVYFNSRPNYDSLKPSLDYLKKDLLQLVQSFEWN